MSGQTNGLAAAALAIAAVVAQLIWPAWPGFHSWQYAAVLALTIVGMLAYVGELRRALRRGAGRRIAAPLLLATVGALVIALAGLASGLLGPDSQTVVRTPGTVQPLPDLGVAAFFPDADPATIGRGDATIVLRRRNGRPTQLAAGGRALVGAAVVQAEPHIAAFVEAWDPAMKHLTITQPAGSAFLSPVLLFPQTVTIVDQALPSDGFATPAREREVKAVYFSAVAAARAHRPEPGPAILFAVDDQRSQRVLPGGIGFAASGETVALGGLRLRATLGSYPALVVSAAPYPPALGLGIALVLAGLIATAIGLRPSSDRDELFTRTTSS